MTTLDRRRTPARTDLAADFLKGRVQADRFVRGQPMQIVAAAAPWRREPRGDAPLDTQALMGEQALVFETNAEGWCWAQRLVDGYVGWTPRGALSESPIEMTHRISVPASFVYPGPSIKLPPLMRLSLGARIRVVASEGDLWKAAGIGYIHARHLAAMADVEPDFVAVAERFEHIPYLWGGNTSEGLDCSGLVQVSLNAAGIEAPRDSDMQAGELGLPVDPAVQPGGLRRGDLIFWKGHVGIMRDAETLLHANGYHMAVASEPLAVAVKRIAEKSYGAITGVRRLQRTTA
jgi:cell wall-associated NlpC family hydrolase